jgi:hypothetical protein
MNVTPKSNPELLLETVQAQVEAEQTAEAVDRLIGRVLEVGRAINERVHITARSALPHEAGAVTGLAPRHEKK